MFDNLYNKGLICIVFLLLISLNLYPISLATNQKKYDTDIPTSPLIINNGPMESFWPIQGHDQRHTGQSPIGTIENPPGVDIWSVRISGSPYGSVLDSNDTIYTVGGWKLHAINPNGTIKWIYEAHEIAETTPAINEDGTIYFGAVGLHAVNPNGTRKWEYSTGNRIRSSPNIGNNGIIYFGDYNGYLHAVYPNGTLKWKYQMSTESWNSVESSPAIDQNGFIYCGAQNGKIYAFYPNGTVKWEYQARSTITYSPCIDDNNIIYISSDGNLHALYQNGTLKWRSNGAGYCSPSISKL